MDYNDFYQFYLIICDLNSECHRSLMIKQIEHRMLFCSPVKKTNNKFVQKTIKTFDMLNDMAFSCFQWFQHSTPSFENRWKEESAFSFNEKKNRTIHSDSCRRKEKKKYQDIKIILYIEFNISGANRTQLYKSNRFPQYFHSRIIEKAPIKRSTIIINLKSIQHSILLLLRCLIHG